MCVIPSSTGNKGNIAFLVTARLEACAVSKAYYYYKQALQSTRRELNYVVGLSHDDMPQVVFLCLRKLIYIYYYTTRTRKTRSGFKFSGVPLALRHHILAQLKVVSPTL